MIREPLPVVGWREWVALPSLGIAAIKAKVDTGARSSSLHAFDVRESHSVGQTTIRFRVHPLQRSARETVQAEAVLLEYRSIRSSTGKASRRPVVIAQVEFCGQSWPIELTLAARDEMGFRMLLGREAVRGRFVVDPSRSFYGGRPAHGKRKVRRRSGRSPRAKKQG